jgi:IPT/TIG domain-containing protein
MKVEKRQTAMLAAMVIVALLSAIAVRGLVAPSYNTAAAATEKQPTIKLQPNSGAPGTIVTITGSDFSPNSHLKLSVDNKELKARHQVTTKEDGSFKITLKTSKNAKDGNLQIKVSDDKGKSAIAYFTVVKKAK